MKTYYMRFGSGDPRTYTAVAATFLLFKTSDGTNITPPGITEVPSGTGIYYFNWGTTTSISFLADAATTSPGSAGRYVFGALDPVDRMDEYGSTLTAIGTTAVALGVTGVALGTTNVALGTSNIALGTSNYAYGTTIIHYLPNHIGTTLVGIGNTAIALGSTIYSLLGGISSPFLLSVGSTASSVGSTSVGPVDLFGYLKRVTENLEGNNTFVKSTGVLSIYGYGSSTLFATKTIANSITMVTKT